jgi:hypothetical protein
VPVIAFRLLVLATVWVFASSSFSLAGGGGGATMETETAPATTEADDPGTLLVPDVRNVPYVFAKGILEDAGFAWRVEGEIRGYAVNLVAKQSVEPGTRVVDTGAPTIVLRLTRNPKYDEVGLPDDTSSYPGTKVVLANGKQASAGAAGTAEPSVTEPATTAPATTSAVTQADNVAETHSTSAQTGEPPTSQAPASTSAGTGSAARPPAFRVPGAPKEPLDEMPLTQRAAMLGRWLAKQTRATPAFWDHYTYQHAWVVAGAKFGWWHGAEALRALVRVDAQLAKRFGHAAALQQTARAALALVERRTAGG